MTRLFLGRALDGQTVARKSVAEVTVIEETLYCADARRLELWATLSNGSHLTVEWLADLNATGLLLSAAGDDEPRPVVDSEVGLPLEVLAQMRSQVAGLAEENQRECEAERLDAEDCDAAYDLAGGR